MSRPQTFDSDAVINAAMLMFWAQGIHRISVDDLLAATGLARSSLYNSFGGKQALFEHAIARYVQQQVDQLRKMLQGRSLQEALQLLLERAAEDNYQDKGCLLVNSAGGLMPDEIKERKLLQQGFSQIFAILEQHVQVAQQNKELAAHLENQPPKDIVLMICSTLSGIRIFHKTGMPKARLKSAARLALVGMFVKP